MAEPSQADERVLWKAYPSWSQFAWLYFMSFLTASRGLLFFKFQIAGWELWLGGAGLLLVCAAALRRWAQYSITTDRVLVRNGYTGHEIEAVPLDRIEAVVLRQGPIAQWMGIGTLVIRTTGGGQVRLRGIKDPEVIRTRLQALRPACGATAGQRSAPSNPSDTHEADSLD